MKRDGGDILLLAFEKPKFICILTDNIEQSLIQKIQDQDLIQYLLRTLVSCDIVH
jgi:hypothetical protein